jgi:bifunctional DNA-binding transcriptional regulator/antitoxin component of YhaV-PrlF toxin-antitoxin module
MATPTTIKPKVQRITSKGQITLPIAWRRKVKTDMIMVREMNGGIHISPARSFKMTSGDRDDDIIIFNADRDNNGVWMPAEEMIARLKKLDRMSSKKVRGHGSH